MAYRFLFSPTLRKIVLLAPASVCILSPQTPPPRTPSFDVASIRTAARRAGEGGNRSRIDYTPTNVTMRNVSLGECVQWAYKVSFYQLTVPRPLDSEGYDIQAKAAAPASVAQLRLMLQDLLAKRFKLVLHRESKMIPVFELTVAKGGPHLPAPKPAADTHAAESLPRILDGAFVFFDTSMPEFAEKLSQLRGVDRPVVDRTGITGYFDITLKSAAAAIREDNGPSLGTILQEQLKLKLVPVKAPLEMLIVDSADKPSAN